MTATASLQPMLACPFSVPTGLALGGQTCCRPWPVLKAAGSSLMYLCGFSRYLNVPKSLTGKQQGSITPLPPRSGGGLYPDSLQRSPPSSALITLSPSHSILYPRRARFCCLALFLFLSHRYSPSPSPLFFFVVAIPSSRIAKAEARTFEPSNGRGRSKQLTRYRHLFTPAIGDGHPLPRRPTISRAAFWMLLERGGSFVSVPPLRWLSGDR